MGIFIIVLTIILAVCYALHIFHDFQMAKFELKCNSEFISYPHSYFGLGSLHHLLIFKHHGASAKDFNHNGLEIQGTSLFVLLMYT